MFDPSPVNQDEITKLAGLHRRSLPESALSWLGQSYLRAFYRYVQSSKLDALVVHRDEAGNIVAAAVIAWQPGNLLRRLLLHTPMAAYLILRAPWVAAGLFRRIKRLANTDSPTPNLESPELLQAPEVVDFYTAPDSGGRGYGTALLSQCERVLRTMGETRYWLKTDVAGNRAFDFYRRHGLVPIGTIVESEARFVVLVKSLDGKDPRAMEHGSGTKVTHNWIDPFEIVRFVIAGGANTILTLAIFQILLFVAPYPIAYAISVAAGVLFAAVIYPNQVFRAPGASLFSRVVATALVSLLVFFAGTSMLHLLQQIGIDPRFGIFVVLPITASLGYCSFRVMSLIPRHRGRP
jgi:putative flippase GtrA/ribosomal protein S18 acetylase RimI-like enzyme